MKFKLIKIYPGSPELGTIIEFKTETWYAYFTPELTEDDEVTSIGCAEILKYKEFWQEVTEEFILPEKWYIKVTSENSKLVSEWIVNSKNPSRKKIVEDGYLTNKWGEYTGIWFCMPPTGHTEITFEQFKKYVLEPELIEKAKEKYPIGTKYINNCGKNCTVCGELKYYSFFEKSFITDGSGGAVYKYGVWAEIVKEEPKFEIGKWYYITAYKEKYEYYIKYTGSQYLEFICHGNYTDKGLFTEVEIKREITDLSEIQQYLPNGHVDKITYEILSYECLWKNGDRSHIPQVFVKNSDGIFVWDSVEITKKYINSSLWDNERGGYVIHSIKRLSDGEIFTVGDKIIEQKELSVIKYFELRGNDLAMRINHQVTKGSSTVYVGINNFEKAKQLLFTTEDGADIFEGDRYFRVWKKDLKTDSYRLIATKQYAYEVVNKVAFHFSSKEAAEQYILLNKPCLSLQEVLNNVRATSIDTLKNNFIELAKNKING